MERESEQAAPPAGRRTEKTPGFEAMREPGSGLHEPGERRLSSESAPGRKALEAAVDGENGGVVQLVGSNRRVLELGTSVGSEARALRDHGCSVVAVGLDPQTAAEAASDRERVIVGDLDGIDLDAELGSDRFDVIVATDALEHLKAPLGTLRRLRGFLAPEGFFVFSVRNVAHGSMRLALLEGRFPYQSDGPLGQTPMRLFTRESIEQLLDEAELAAVELYRHEVDVDRSDVTFDPCRVPAAVMRALESDPDARTERYVVKAIPLEVPGLRGIQERMRELAQENARLRETDARATKLQELVATLSDREVQLRSSLIDAHDQLLRRDEEILKLREDLLHLQASLESAQAELIAHQELVAQLRARIDRILSTLPARAYLKVRGWLTRSPAAQ
jgi:SAM-dependent methyltransferase